MINTPILFVPVLALALAAGPENADDHLTKSIHAFSHFTAIYTHKNLVLCHLQGKIHPTMISNCLAIVSCSIIFKVSMIVKRLCASLIHKAIRINESACENNWICCALNLSGAVVSEEKPVFSETVAEDFHNFNLRESAILTLHCSFYMNSGYIIKSSSLHSSWFSILANFFSFARYRVSVHTIKKNININLSPGHTENDSEDPITWRTIGKLSFWFQT